MAKTHIKVCCIQSVTEMKLALQYGVSAIGLVSKMPSGPGVISEASITKIAAAVPRDLATFLLTSETESHAIIAQQQRTRCNTIQICDRVTEATYHDIRIALPGITLVQVIHVCNEDAVSEAISIAPNVDAILLDSGNLALTVKELGGTGRTHNWEISRRIVASVPIPVWLAGGLSATNVQAAVELVRPHGVDICSGVRTNGFLDQEKLSAFTTAVSSSN